MTESMAWVDGRVFTGSAYAEAFLVEGEELVAVGTNEEVRRGSPTGTATTELGGRLVVPGLIDAHFHLADSVVARQAASLRGATSNQAVVDRLRRVAESAGPGPIIGFGWDESLFAEGRPPTREDLDRVSIERPVVAHRTCRHAAALNSRALEILGLGPHSKDPFGGRLGRDRNGVPNGLLHEQATAPLSSFTLDLFEAAPHGTRELAKQLLAFGITSIGAMSASAREYEIAREQIGVGRIPLRVRMFGLLQELEQFRTLRHSISTGDLRVPGTKVVLDGSLGNRSAWLREPYSDRPSERGFPLWPREWLLRQLSAAAKDGYSVALHAIGDRALVEALGLLSELGLKRAARIEHASVVPSSILPELKQLRPTVVVQPLFTSSDSWIEARLGPRARTAYPFRSLIEGGLVLAGSSDAPTETYDPWAAMKVATERPDRPEQAIGVDQAFGLYTRSGGVALSDSRLGHLRPGAKADFVVTKVRGLEEALAAGASGVAETWIGGERHYLVDPERPPTTKA